MRFDGVVLCLLCVCVRLSVSNAFNLHIFIVHSVELNGLKYARVRISDERTSPTQFCILIKDGNEVE